MPLHTVTWSQDAGLYGLATHGHAEGHVRLGDDAAWWQWLGGATSFAFHGASGSLNVYQEARPRGGRYWYAYHTTGGRTRKHYLGRTARISLARLEEVAATLAGVTDPAPLSPAAMPTPPLGGDVAESLPTTKFAPPQTPPTLVGREHLLAALDAASAAPLTLVAAPAGWGKTTALAAWARRHPDRVAWLSLDSADDDPVRFWAVVIYALRARVPGVGATALALLRAHQLPPLPAVVTSLINELAGESRAVPLMLVLDDYQVIAEPAIHESVAFLLAHLPAGLRLVLAGRADPDLPLARLRARSQLVELRAADLRFTEADAAAFLQGAVGITLAAGEVAALAARTEGWAVGLQLAALALRGQDDPAAWLTGFTGGHRYLLDYVEDEILVRQPPAIRQFLLRAAILPRLGADLCAAVTGEAASGAILRGLEHQNLFLIPLDEERRWYRLHGLFREALLARAGADAPDLLPKAHWRAARWHANHGDGREAVGHALAAGDYPFAGDLIAREAPHLWLGGEARAVLMWLLALPDDVLWRHARLALDAALRLLESVHAATGSFYGGVQMQVERMLERIEAGLARWANAAFPETEQALLRGRLRLLRALIASRVFLLRGDEAALSLLAQEAAALTETEEVRWQMVAHAITYWLTEALQRDGGLLIARLRAAKGRATEAGDSLATSRVLRWLAYAYGRAGQSHAAYQEGLEGLALMERRGEQSVLAAYLQYLCARVCYEWNRLDEATDCLRQMLLLARTWQNADLLIFGELELARLALARGDLADACHALERAGALARQEHFEEHTPWVDAERVRYWLAAGDLPAAWDWAVRVEFAAETFDRNRCGEVLALVRVLLAHRRYPEALATLERFEAHLDRPGDGSTAIEYLALRVVALHGAGECAEARTVAARLFTLTEPEGCLRVFLDEGVPMERALASLLAATDDVSPDIPALPRASIARLLAAFAEERQRGRTAGSVPTTAAPTPPIPAALVEPLTRREREVLMYLADGASNQEIADALALSVNTVKRHVGGLLGKLGATSRTGAVARARVANLL